MYLCIELKLMNRGIARNIDECVFSMSKSKGHTGCSTGFNSSLYRDTLSENLNTAGREQIHACLDKLTSSLTQMNFVRETFIKRFFRKIFLQDLNHYGYVRSSCSAYIYLCCTNMSLAHRDA